MNRFLTAAILLLLHIGANAQNAPMPNEYLQQVFAPLDKSVMSTGYLVNQQFSFAEPGVFQGNATDTTRADINTFGMLFGVIHNSRIINGRGLPIPYPSYLDSVKSCQPDQSIPIALMSWQYERIVPELALQHNLLTYENGQFFDVPNRAISPYVVCSLFVAAPVRTSANTLSPVFSLPSALWYSNLGSASPSVSLDAGDGLGWRTISERSIAQAQYSKAGDKTLTLRLTYANRTVYCYMKLTVTEPPVEERDWGNTPDESIEITATQSYLGAAGTGTMQVFYNCEGKKMLKPLIVIEGIEFLFPAAGNDVTADVDDFFARLEDQQVSLPTLRDIIEPEGYDIIYVDWSALGGADYIQRNAYLIEEVIRWVNEQKAAAGSNEENVIIGISMGGLVGKYALLDMQNKGLDHDTRLFITFDAPLRGANIPIGSQCMVDYLVDLNNITITVDPPGPFNPVTLTIPPVPQLAEAIDAIQAPATRQMLLYHVNAVNGSSEPVNPEKVAFFAELDAMGQLGMRHVAISNGASDGTAIENNTFAGVPFFALTGTFAVTFTIPLPPPPVPIPGFPASVTITPVSSSVGFSVSATGNNVFTQVLDANITINAAGFNIPFNIVDRNVTCFTRPYDVVPGGTSTLGTLPLGLGAAIIPAIPGLTVTGGLTATAPAINHHTFIPAFSALSAVEPGNMLTPAACGTPSRCSLSDPTNRVINPSSGLPESNQDHVTIDARIAALLIDELITQGANPYPLPAAPNVLSTYYNAGLKPQSAINDLIITTSQGKLSINNTGHVGYNSGPVSPDILFTAHTICADITVENAARLVIGADGGAKHGVLNVTPGSTVHIKSGGVLQITSNQSALIVKPNAQLILDPGAIVRLEKPGSAIRIEGELVVNGDIVFSGQGYFDFAGAPNQLKLAAGYPTFNLTGYDKNQELIRLSTSVQLQQGKHLNWSKGRISVRGGTLGIGKNSDVACNNMSVIGQNGGLFINAQECGKLAFNRCNFEQLTQALQIQTGASLLIDFSHFKSVSNPISGYKVPNLVFNSNVFERYDLALEWLNGFSAVLNFNNFHGNGDTRAIAFQSTPLTLLNACLVEGHTSAGLSGHIDASDYRASKAAIESFSGILVVKNTQINNNGIGIKSLDLPGEGLSASAVLLIESSGLGYNTAGVYMEGGSENGLVLADCASFWLNSGAIVGADITLMLDSWNSSIYDFDTDVPNSFVKSAFGAGLGEFVEVCYGQKAVGSSTLMRNNYWASFDGAGTTSINPLPNIHLQDASCSSNIAVPTTVPAAVRAATCVVEGRPEEFGQNDPERDCQIDLLDNTGAQQTVNWQFHKGYYYLKTDSLEYGVEILRPVADLWQSDMSAFNPNCRQYIATSRAIVDGFDTSLGLDMDTRPSERRLNNRTASAQHLLLVPNPATEQFMIELPSNKLCDLFVVNAHGQIIAQYQKVSGKPVFPVENWPAGLYQILVRDHQSAQSWSVKLVVANR